VKGHAALAEKYQGRQQGQDERVMVAPGLVCFRREHVLRPFLVWIRKPREKAGSRWKVNIAHRTGSLNQALRGEVILGELFGQNKTPTTTVRCPAPPV
jgi:hypothetical protein